MTPVTPGLSPVASGLGPFASGLGPVASGLGTFVSGLSPVGFGTRSIRFESGSSRFGTGFVPYPKLRIILCIFLSFNEAPSSSFLKHEICLTDKNNAVSLIGCN